MNTAYLSQLRERGLVAQVNHEEELQELLSKGTTDEKGNPYAVYCGFDPTAKSLHIGHLIALLVLRRAQDAGLIPIILFGGATALIGDPTDRTDMRPMSTREEIAERVENFKKLTMHYFRWDVANKPIVVNNADWYESMSWIEFARGVGVHFTVSRLLSSEFSKSRLEHGLTFMELSYQLMQGYDFLHLSRLHNAVLQVGGDDQWSNVLAGADLIRRVDRKKAFALTTPLLAAADGKKIGKTTGNAVWLDRELTSPYELFQHFRNCHDLDVEKLYRTYTFLSLDEIKSLVDQATTPINQAKEKLAFEITALIHGKEEAEAALKAAHALFQGGGDLSAAPSTALALGDVEAGLDILSLLIRCGLCASRGEARKLVQGNGLTLNNERLTDPSYQVKASDFETEHNALVLRKGKKDYHLVKIDK